jgi:polysaccharide deacetylase family protein (PEP-CTERM system associated)
MNGNEQQVVNVFTVDFEDWYQGLEVIPLKEWGRFESRIEKNTERILRLLEDVGVKATFFVLGYMAEKFPRLVREIAGEGHEIGTHGYSHQLVYRQSSEEFRREMIKSIEILEGIITSKITSYRAPFFSITESSLWALNILCDLGIRFDSSIFPVLNYRYGIPRAPRFPHWITTKSGSKILEFPMSTIRVLGKNVPVAGGAYFRIFPYQFIRAGIKSINRKNQPAIFYLHPWEIDPEHPKIDLPRRISLTHYYNLSGTENKLRRLLKDFQFTTLKEVLENAE